MAGWDHGGGFSVDAAVRIEGNDRAGLERLLRYCARPSFALEQHLQQRDAGHLVYHCPKPRPDGSGDMVLTPLELIDRIASLVPRPRTHRHRYYGVLVPNATAGGGDGAGPCRRPASADFHAPCLIMQAGRLPRSRALPASVAQPPRRLPG